MEKIKIIDLFNKIANGEEVPKRIKVDDKEYYYDETDSSEFYRYRGILEEELLTNYANLNDEVEIIEEDNKIEKIDYIGNGEDGNLQYEIINKLNEVIDYINKEN